MSEEQGSTFLLGKLNANLMNYNNHRPTNEFLDLLASNYFFTTFYFFNFYSTLFL